MAFNIITTDGQEHIWYVNGMTVKERKPKFKDVDYKIPIISLFQASGDELDFIKKHFNNVPTTPQICTWRGEMAQFIYDNL